MKQATHFAVQPGWRLLLSDMEVDLGRVLRQADLPADLFARQDATITPAQFFQFWQAIEQAAGGDAALPIKVGKAISVEAFDPPIFASLCSPNMNIALQRLSAFKKLIGPMALAVDIGASHTSATLECYANAAPIPPSFAATELIFLTQLIRMGTRHPVIPREAVLPELPDGLDGYSDFLGVRPKIGSAIRIVFSSEDATRQFLTANEPMWAFFEPALRKRLSTLDAAASMRDRVKAVLLEGLPSGQHTIEEVAKQLAVSKRTLQRQLGEESATFKDILTATRQQLALHYLRKPMLAQGEIAFLLGFQDVNSFIRAFKEWQGVTPGVFREDVRVAH
ncbi:AraC family transcriptional regulator ligand-binding domain-containing protein [Lysobacter sp. K5869]|uniref:AraC family transcriptional regulator n=1 Tax=Lysobacter sp. K5869 TaxID=2820808 RepID=UPI001C064910|nr:AraC family transcriptional regulator [Lysobacter sp. K5869]QWP75906.1 AraC family transcriptional regulator ligand-binding domain-containing protein [Lysobacter sp. K5869]